MSASKLSRNEEMKEREATETGENLLAPLVERLRQRIRREGFVVTIDYGAGTTELLTAPHRMTGTLRGFSKHQFAKDVLEHPGEQNLTTTISHAPASQFLK